MPSIQDVANAAYRIGDNARELAQRSMLCADAIGKHADRLNVIVKGSASGEEAVRRVGQAQAAVRQSAGMMTTLDTAIKALIAELAR
ncbi:MAG: hypothetical protein Q4B08_11780 [Propionibacteriaceae bacterium]|nr:hypothetical protein [Propionibacteriaceae bacterium]